MEGLAITPDGKTLAGFMQSPLVQNGGHSGRANHIVTIDVATGTGHRYAHDNFLIDTAKACNSSELMALNSHEFLVLERDGKGRRDGTPAVVKRIYKIDLVAATDNDFIPGTAGRNNFYVFRFDDSDLGASVFQNQQICAVPEPQTWAEMAAGLLLLAGTSLRRRR